MLLAALFSAVMMLSYSSPAVPPRSMRCYVLAPVCVLPMTHLWVQGHDGDEHFVRVLS